MMVIKREKWGIDIVMRLRQLYDKVITSVGGVLAMGKKRFVYFLCIRVRALLYMFIIPVFFYLFIELA